jgi:hypothetical protein
MLATIHAAADAIRRGQTSPIDLLQTCLERDVAALSKKVEQKK